MRTNQEKRYSRVAEWIYRYNSGGFRLRHKVEGKTMWHKVKSVDLQAASREARDALKTGILVQRKQSARTVTKFSQEGLSRYNNAAETTRKKVAGYHAKVLPHWQGKSNASVASAKKKRRRKVQR